jgi:hypothetical protein
MRELILDNNRGDKMTSRILKWTCRLLFLSDPLGFCQEYRVKFKPNLGHQISGLKWDDTQNTQEPLLQIRKSTQKNQSQYYVVIHGKYTGNSHELLFTGNKVSRKKDGSFDLEIEINGAQTNIQLISIDMTGSTENELDMILFPEWESFKKNRNESTKKKWSHDLKKIRVMSTYLTNITGHYLTGALYWTDRKTNALAVGGNILYQLGQPTILRIHQLIVGYSAFLPTGYFTSEIKAGLGIQF